MKACFAHQMREIDKSATDIGKIPSIVLMENAAMACMKTLNSYNLKSKRIAVFCGKGNNGGDGFAIARHLINQGIETEVFLVLGDNFSGDSLINYEILKNMGAEIHETIDLANIKYKILSFDIIVDAIFGTGLKGDIKGDLGELISYINKYKKFTLSVDVPSGIDADTGKIWGNAINADVTVTFAAYKVGMLLYPARDYCGEIFIDSISIPKSLMEHININVTDYNFLEKIMPKRQENSHKGDYGKLLIVGGAKGMTGAATLAAKSATRCGVGLITLGVPESLNPIFEEKLTEQMTLPLPDQEGIFTKDCVKKIIEKADKFDCLVFGPGLGRNTDATEILREILVFWQKPLVIDADGLFALSKDMDILKNASCDIILTPHEMEFSYLTGKSLEDIKKNRIELSRAFSKNYGVTLILKGSNTIISEKSGVQYINIWGNSGMAKGGSGDVLAGMVGAFLARGIDPFEASILGVGYHSLAGDKAAEIHGKNALTPKDIISSIPLILPVE